MEFNTDMKVDADELGAYIEDTLPGLLIESAPSFECAAWVLSTLLDAYNAAMADED